MTQVYYFWDVLATTCLVHPELYQLQEWETVIVPTCSSQGRTKVETGARKIQAMGKLDKEKYYSYILQQWAR